MTQIPAPPIQAPDQAQHLYALQLIAYACAHGTGLMSDAQIEQAIHFWPLALWRIDPPLAEALARVRRQITNSQKARQEARQARQAKIDQQITTWMEEIGLAPDGSRQDDQAGQDQADQDPIIDPRDQAIRMMRAALQIIQGGDLPGDHGGGGGSRVPVTPRPPKFPPSNSQAQPPHQAPPAPPTRQAPDFRF